MSAPAEQVTSKTEMNCNPGINHATPETEVAPPQVSGALPHSFPEFPPEAYLGVLADFAELYSHYYESPKEFLFFAAILQVGIALCGRARADFGSLPTQPRLYGLKIGPVGTSKKSTADLLAHEFFETAMLYGERHSDNPDDDFYDTPEIGASNAWRFVLPGAGSGEGVLEALQKNKRVLLVNDEFERFAKKASAEGSVLGTAVNELFEKTEYANATKGNVLCVSGVYLGFSANIPLEQFESTSGAGKMQDLGLWSRLMFVVGDRRLRILKPQDPLKQDLEPLLEKLGSYFKALPTRADPNQRGKLEPAEEIKLSLTDQAQRLWETFETVIGCGADATRLDIIGMRIMAILAFTSGKDQIDEEVVAATLAFLKYQKTVREHYKPSRAETSDAKIEATVMRCVRRAHDSRKSPISERDIRRNTSIDKTYGVQALRSALERLCGAAQLQESKSGPQGRTRAFDLGPEADA